MTGVPEGRGGNNAVFSYPNCIDRIRPRWHYAQRPTGMIVSNVTCCMNIERKETEFETTFIIMDEMVSQNMTLLSEEFNHFVRTDTRDAVVDLSFVRKIDSMSIATLIRFKNALTEKGRTMHLSNPTETVLRVLELSGMDKFLME